MSKDQLFEIRTSGFKSISHDYPVEIKFGEITVLLGANGSGKSNIISFFNMLYAMTYGSFQKLVETAGTSQFFLHNGKKIYAFELTGWQTMSQVVLHHKSVKR